jgi:hypothetical protein
MTVGAAALTQAIYLTESGDTAPITAHDIHQGQMGDCFLVSALGELAMRHPNAIRKMIHQNADGTETVTLYATPGNGIPNVGASAFEPIMVKVDNVFPTYSVNSGAGQDQVGSQKEIWAQVLEKAIATVRGGYGAIANGGNPATVMEQLTGQRADAYYPSSLSADMLKSFAAAGDLITFDTPNKTALGYNLLGAHAYMFDGVVNTANGPAVSLKNPWGFNDPALVLVSQMATVFAEVDVGRSGPDDFVPSLNTKNASTSGQWTKICRVELQRPRRRGGKRVRCERVARQPNSLGRYTELVSPRRIGQ